jgi:TonB-dependent starch-binding outer membrane protein SusC
MNFKQLFSMLMVPLLLIGISAWAQNKVVTGTITDAKDGSALPGVSVLVKGTTTGTQTSADGTFRLSVPDNATTLEISYVGYATQEVPITGGNIKIALQQSAAALNELVVIGYGTQQKKDLTGAITSINAKDFQKGDITSPDQLIAGKVAGVVVTSNGGEPGSGSTIRIRGTSSLNANQDPLIVIDGVPLDNEGVSGSPNALSLINPNDIENITILKDASATAIYGNRASNGVILITTKKGAAGGKLHVNFSSLNSVSVKTNEVSVLSAAQIRQVVDSLGTTQQKALLGSSNTNWQNEIYQPAFGTDNNISLSGGVKNLPYRLSLEYLDQAGILKTNTLQRTSLGLNLSPVLLNGDLHVNINVLGSYNDNRFANQGAIGSALSMDPTQPVYSGNDKYGGYFEWLQNGAPNQLATENPLGMLEEYHSTSTVERSIGNIALEYKLPFFPDLKANVNAGYDLSTSNGNVTIPDSVAMDYAQGGYYENYSQYKRNELFDFYLNYVKDVKSINSHFDVTGGYEYQDFFFNDPVIDNMNYAKTDTLSAALRSAAENTLVSFYGRLNYSYKDKYLLTATVRADGSSRFSPANRWGTFPSMALAWRIKQESFLKDSKAVSELKLRLGYGLTGQQDIGSYYPYLPVYTLSSNVAQYEFGDQSYYTYRAEPYDPNIKWENTATYNIGLDYGFLNGNLYGSIDAYYKKTSNLLVDIPTAMGANLSNQLLTNVGNMENRGLEFSVNANAITTKNFNWTVGFNIAYNVNKITKLSKLANDTSAGILHGSISGGTGNSIQIWSVGYDINTFYVYKQVYDQNGNPIQGVYADVNNNPSNLFERYKSGDPTVTIGFTSQFSYKKLSLSFVLRGDFGNYMYNNVATSGTLNSILNSLGFVSNANASYLKTGFTASQYFSNYYVENASFLRMDNITLGYDFGKIIHQSVGLRLTGTVQNVFVITNYTGLDPEVYGGIDNNIYPRPRIYSLGLNLNF